MIFYLARLEPDEAKLVVAELEARLDAVALEQRTRLSPAVTGLSAIAAGESYGAKGVQAASGGRRLLGGTTSRHGLA